LKDINKINEVEEWDNYWKQLYKQHVLIGKFFSWYRRRIISKEIAYFFDKYFKKNGTYVDCGSGSSETSIKIKKYKRTIIALDISPLALLHAKKIKIIDKFIQADIKKLPFKNNSIDGIWNVGVMEHFKHKEINQILNEFYRVLKEDSMCILFWPGFFGPTNLIFRPLEFFIKKIKKDSKNIAPKEPSIIKSKSLLKKQILDETKFKKVKIFLSPRSLFVHYVVICKK